MRRTRLAVIDPGMGNLKSVCRAWEYVGAEVQLVTSPDEVKAANALVFPGQGAIVDCMEALKSTGFDDYIRDWIKEDRPFFGICLGLQALFEYSEEGDVSGLGIFPGSVRRFKLSQDYKIPHMGWNQVAFKRDFLTEGLDKSEEQFYFVHSYHVVTDETDLVWSETEYGYSFVSGINQGNCFATQFHPEKSQKKGLQLYANFMSLISTL